MDLVLYRKQRVMGEDLASRGKYSHGPHRFVLKAGGGEDGPRFAWKVHTVIRNFVSYRKQGVVGVDLASRRKYNYRPPYTSFPQVSYTCHKPVSQVWLGLVFFGGGAGGRNPPCGAPTAPYPSSQILLRK